MKVLITAFFVFLYLLTTAQEISIGLITDCQFCNCEYSERWNNDYRKGTFRLTEAVETLNKRELDGVFHLGDFIDRGIKSYDKVTPIFEKLNSPHYHILGNHDFSVAPQYKSTIKAKLNLDSTYYRLSYTNWEVIVLDGTDISTYKTTDSIEINRADSIRKHFLTMGRTQALPWNGAIGIDQLKWLDTELTIIDKSNKNTLVLCHFPIYPESDANLWNDKELITILEKHVSVKAFINGHHHPGNYQVKEGIHYVTLQGMVLTTNENSFSIGHLDKNKIVIEGFGREPNRTLKF